jgi:hypothetical protein
MKLLKEKFMNGQVKERKQLEEHFSEEEGLDYNDMFLDSDNSIYRGQVIKNDTLRKKMVQMGKLNANCRMPNDTRQGYGIKHWSDGANYEGYWVQNVAQGFGKSCHADGDIYEGMFKNDFAHGFGVYTRSDGSIY